MLFPINFFVLIISIFTAFPSAAQSNLTEQIKTATFQQKFCSIKNDLKNIENEIQHGSKTKDELIWLLIGKANYEDYCNLNKAQSKTLLEAFRPSVEQASQVESRAIFYLTLGDIYTSESNPSEMIKGCDLYSKSIEEGLNDVHPYIKTNILVQNVSYCEQLPPIEQYQKLLNIHKSVIDSVDLLIKKIPLDAIYNLFIQEGELGLATNLGQELLSLYKSTYGPHYLLVDTYHQSLDYLTLGRVDDSQYYLDLIENFSGDKRLHESLINVLKLQLYFATQDYQQTFVYAEKLLPEYQSFKNYANSGKLAIIRAIICLELNKTSCVEDFVGDIENQVTDEDYKQEYLPYFLARYQSLDNNELSNQIFKFQQLWQKKINKAQDSSLRQAIAQVSQNALISDVTENTLNSEEKTFNNRSIIIFGIFVSVFISITLIFNRKQTKPTDFDDLTHLYTRRAALKKSKSVAKLGKNQPHAIVLFDLDNFKLLNQRFGYLTGDLALNQIAQLTTNYVRESDIVGRLSGEEFFIFMPFTSRDVARDRVKKLKKQIDSHTITTLSGDKTKLTASFAVSFVKDYKQIEKEVEILHQSIAKQQPISTLSPVICL